MKRKPNCSNRLVAGALLLACAGWLVVSSGCKKLAQPAALTPLSSQHAGSVGAEASRYSQLDRGIRYSAFLFRRPTTRRTALADTAPADELWVIARASESRARPADDSPGSVASLLTEERPNIFTQSVANIEPGKAIDVTIRYFHTLAYVDGRYEFVFPMVIGPRFNPPGMTTGVGAIARGAHGTSGQKTEVHYLKPHERSGHDISLKLEVDAGVPIEEFACRSHKLVRETTADGKLVVSLSPTDKLPNKDFVLRDRVAGNRIKSSLLTHRDARGGYFTLMLYPPEELAPLARQPLELVFVLDCSGSMSGIPIAQAKAAIERGLRLLRPGDSFQLINFEPGRNAPVARSSAHATPSS